MTEFIIQPCTMDHLEDYASVYARAFAGEPWKSHWTAEGAVIHVRERLSGSHPYGLACSVEGKIVGVLLTESMLLDFGRIYEIGDLAVAPEWQGRGIGTALLKRALEELPRQGAASISLVTARDGKLPKFYEHFGFKEETRLVLMSRE